MKPRWRGENVLSSGVEREGDAHGQFNNQKFSQRTILGLDLLIVGLVFCGYGFSLLFEEAEYRATVRIKIEPVGSDICMPPRIIGFDPYFVQTTFKIIKSEIVLGDVITNLNLNELWGEKYGADNPLKTAATFKRLQRHLSFEPVFNANFIYICFTDDDANEAAKIANAFAAAYIKYRMALIYELTDSKLFEDLQRQYDLEEKEIQAMQTNTNEPRARLDQLLDQHRLLSLKLAAEKADMFIQKNPPVQIVDPAVPPEFPLPRNDPLAVSLLIVGLFPTAAGWLLLKSYRQPII